MFIVVWVEKQKGRKGVFKGSDDLKDQWEAFHNFDDADKHYKKLCNKKNVWTASLCNSIRSTDYE